MTNVATLLERVVKKDSLDYLLNGNSVVVNIPTEIVSADIRFGDVYHLENIGLWVKIGLTPRVANGEYVLTLAPLGLKGIIQHHETLKYQLATCGLPTDSVESRIKQLYEYEKMRPFAKLMAEQGNQDMMNLFQQMIAEEKRALGSFQNKSNSEEVVLVEKPTPQVTVPSAGKLGKKMTSEQLTKTCYQLVCSSKGIQIKDVRDRINAEGYSVGYTQVSTALKGLYDSGKIHGEKVANTLTYYPIEEKPVDEEFEKVKTGVLTYLRGCTKEQTAHSIKPYCKGYEVAVVLDALKSDGKVQMFTRQNLTYWRAVV